MQQRMIEEITRFIFIRDSVRPTDMIFLPGGSHPEQGEEAAALYHKGYAPYVMPSGGVSIKTGRFGGVKSRAELYNGDYATDCAFLSDVLRIGGVPPRAILGEDKAGYTKENALLSRALADRLGLSISTAIVCCKCFHARRSLICYQLAFPQAEIIIHPVPYRENGIEINAGNWYTTQAGVRRVLGELARCGNQFTQEIMAFCQLPDECPPL